MKNRLYIIEGLPCSGKSTTSAFIAEILKEKYNVCYVDEGSGNHPADYEFHSFISENEMLNFSRGKIEKFQKMLLVHHLLFLLQHN